jgi:hypothetical protein
MSGGPGERDWMRPSVVRVQVDPGDPAHQGNDSLPHAVAEHARNDALRSDIFDGFDRRCYREGPQTWPPIHPRCPGAPS